MRSPENTLACTLRRRRRMLLVGGFTVPAIVLGSVLGTSAAFADGSPMTKSDLSTAFGTAAAVGQPAPTPFELTNDLTGAAADETSDVQTLGAGKALTIDLKGHALDLDQVLIGAGAQLSVIDTGTTHGSLQVGTSLLTPGDNSGVRLSTNAKFIADQNARVTVAGSAALPGVGTANTAATGTAVTVTGGASLTATGGTGAAGIGGSAVETVTADGGTIIATGGAGAAGIGGSAAKGGSTVTAKNDARITAQGGVATGTATDPANAIGGGQGSTDFGSLAIEAGSKVALPTGAVENVPTGGVITNEGEIDVDGTLKGAGRIDNSGTIIPSTHGTVADALNVTGNDYAVSLAAGTAGTVTPTSKRVLADTFTHGGVSLPDAAPDTSHFFTGWKVGGAPFTAGTTLSSTGDVASNGAKPVTVTADYDTLVSLSQSPDLGNLNTATAVSKQLTADGSDGANGKTWSQPTDGHIPAGLILDATGLLHGTPTQTGTFSFTVDITGLHNTVPQTYTGSVGVIPVMANATLTAATVGKSYTAAIADTTGTTVTAYTTPANTLPGGLTLNANGTLSGKPTAAAGGTKTFVVTATNDYGSSSSTYTLLTHTIPVFTTTTLPSAVLGTSYSKQIVTDGDGPIDYAVDPATPLPGRLTLSPTGLLSGVATRAVSTTIKVIAHSAYGTTTQDLVFVAGDVPAITTATVLNPTVGDSTYTQQFTSTGNGVITWSITDLPAGMSFSDTGLLSGPITTHGTYTFTITSESSFGTVDKDFTITAGTKPSISTTSLADPVQGNSYAATVRAGGDDGPTFSATGLPAGLTINATTGAISGTTQVSGLAHVIVTATSTWGHDSEPFDITVHAKPVWATANALPDATTGAHVSVQLSAPGDGTSTRFSSSDLPDTLGLTSGGLLTGHVDASESFTITATNDYDSVDRTFTITAGDAPKITSSAPDAPTLNDATYSATIAASGDDSPTFSVTAGHLPTGLDVDHTTGVISGKPTAAGPFTFQITAHSKWGDDPKEYTVLVGAKPAILSATLLNPTLGAHYDQPVNTQVTLGTEVSYDASGTLPHGLSLNTVTGHISGDVATDATEKTFTVTVHTVYGDDHVEYTLTPGTAAHITTVTGDLGTPVAGHSFSASIAGRGDGVTYALTDGALPTGLTLASNGAISGTPTSTVAARFTVTASSVYGNDTATYTLTAATPPTFTTGTLPWAVAGHSYSQVIAASGTGAVTLHVQGELPKGLSFDPSTGTLSGTPEATGTQTISIVGVSDLATTVQPYAFTAVGAPALSTVALPKGTAGAAYSTALVASGDGTMSYAVTSGSLPGGLSLNGRTGAISGTPTSAGTATFTVTATSGFGTDSKQLTLAVDAAPVVATPPATTVPSTPASTAPTTPAAPAPAAPQLPVAPAQTVKLGHPFSMSVKANSTVGVTYTAKGALPKGVELNRSTGIISGTPTEEGTFAFAVTAKSTAGSDTQRYKLVVPEAQQLIAASATWTTPIQGQPFDVTIKGLQKGERWTVTANGKTIATGRTAKAGTITTAVTLKKSLTDKSYTIRVSGSRAVTDPAKTASDEFVVTAITAKKSLKLKSASGVVRVTNLAAHEEVSVSVDGKKVAVARADAKGVYEYSAKSWKAGTHKVVVTGKTSTRAGKLTVKVKK